VGLVCRDMRIHSSSTSPSLASAWTAIHPQALPFLEGLAEARLWQLPPDLEDLPATVNDRLRKLIDEGPTTDDDGRTVNDER